MPINSASSRNSEACNIGTNNLACAHRGQRVVFARNLLATLRGRELAQAAKDIAAETGLEHRPAADGQRVAGIYRRSLMLASGRYAMLDDGMSRWCRGNR